MILFAGVLEGALIGALIGGGVGFIAWLIKSLTNKPGPDK